MSGSRQRGWTECEEAILFGVHGVNQASIYISSAVLFGIYRFLVQPLREKQAWMSREEVTLDDPTVTKSAAAS